MVDATAVNIIKQGQLQFVLSEVNMNEVVKNAIDRINLTNPDVKIIFDDQSVTGIFPVIGDSDKLIQMTSALLSNAIKFSLPLQQIHILLQRNKRFIILKIKDQGKGIPQKDLAKIFEGFFKGDTNGHEEGMGVGLLVAKHIIEHHKGKLNITSKENKGTTIEVKLPRAKI